jgi:hypothetical protein
METFIRVAELWLPNKDRSRLEFGGGLYGSLTNFRAASEGMQFAFDEGLPGKAWAAGHPIILKEFENSYFKRTDAAKAAGLTCGVALPVFAGEFLMAVAVFFCGDDEARVGAIELWTNGPEEAHFMSLADGYYGAAEMFEFNSRVTKFPRGYGLPGRVWKKEMPMLVKDLFNSRSFLRWEQAVQIGVNRGLGIPYGLASGQIWVVTFLSALDTPIARRFEIWVPNAARDGLVFDAGDCDTQANLAAEYAGTTIARGEGVLGEIWRSGIPALSDHIANEPSVSGRSARAAGMTSIVALPFIDGGSLKAVAAWYL